MKENDDHYFSERELDFLLETRLVDFDSVVRPMVERKDRLTAEIRRALIDGETFVALNVMHRYFDMPQRDQIPAVVKWREARERYATPDYTYFIGCGDYVKIGRSVSPTSRLLDLQIGNPWPLAILAVVHSSVITEVAAHRRWAANASSGEWFHRSPEMDAWIEALLQRAEAGHVRMAYARQLLKRHSAQWRPLAHLAAAERGLAA